VSRLAGRVALVTGASRGIGEATAAALEREGAFVIRVARSLTDHRTAGSMSFRGDVTSQADVDRITQQLDAHRLIPHILVNNAGSFLIRPLADTTVAEFRAQLEANLVGPFVMLRSLVPHWKQRGSGHVVTMGSIADHLPLPGNAAYGAAKHGLRALHDILTLELRDTGVTTTLVCPAATDTTVWDTIDPAAVPGLPPRSAMLRPEEVAQAVVFAVTRPDGVCIDEIRLSAR
jgi:NADP-dependent 3-hydroxy acid dehydrogenase YdfG